MMMLGANRSRLSCMKARGFSFLIADLCSTVSRLVLAKTFIEFPPPPALMKPMPASITLGGSRRHVQAMFLCLRESAFFCFIKTNNHEPGLMCVSA